MDSLRAKAKIGHIDAINLQKKVWDMHKLQVEKSTKHKAEFSWMNSSTSSA